MLDIDQNGQPVSPVSDASHVYISDGSTTVWDESGPHEVATGHWLEFDETAFAQSYQAQAGAPLQALAALYGTDPASLLAEHPELWGIAVSEHAINAGPPLAGFAMGDPRQFGALDLYMSDPQWPN